MYNVLHMHKCSYRMLQGVGGLEFLASVDLEMKHLGVGDAFLPSQIWSFYSGSCIAVCWEASTLPVTFLGNSVVVQEGIPSCTMTYILHAMQSKT